MMQKGIRMVEGKSRPSGSGGSLRLPQPKHTPGGTRGVTQRIVVVVALVLGAALAVAALQSSHRNGAAQGTNVLVNGDFSQGLTGWTVLSQPGCGPEGSATVISDDHPASMDVARFLRSGALGCGGTIALVRQIDQSAGNGSVTLAADVKVVSHDLCGGGQADGKEDPVFLAIQYRDSSDVLREFWHGFYTGVPCIGDKSTQVVQGEWYSYSFDLTTLTPPPATIVSLTVGGNGHDFDGRAANLKLITGASLPPCLPSGNGVNVRADIDGRSRLILQGNSVQWQHFDNAAPGRQSGDTLPTCIDGETWHPTWPDTPTSENRDCGGCLSSLFNPSPALPSLQNFSGIQQIGDGCRSSCQVVETPTSGNGYKLVIEFNDNAIGDSAWYEIEILFEAVPPPICYILGRELDGIGAITAPNPQNSPGCPQDHYNAGAAVSFTAHNTPDPTWQFDHWSATAGSFSCTNCASTTFTMPTQNAIVTAHFVKQQGVCWTLTLVKDGGFGFLPMVDPTNCANDKYTDRSVVHLTAEPNQGWRVARWRGTDNDASTALTNTVTMTSDKEVGVLYEFIQTPCYSLELVVDGGSGDKPTAEPPNCAGTKYFAGSLVTVTAHPAPGWQVDRWRGTVDDNSTSTTNSVRMDDNKQVGVSYVQGGSNSGLELIGLEVTQGIQNWLMDVPLLAGRRTVVRAHVRSSGDAVSGVRAQLEARRPDGTQLGAKSNQGGDITVWHRPDAALPGDSFYFEVPESWTSGTVVMQFTGISRSFLCAEPATPGDPASNCRATVMFEPSPAAEVRFVGVVWGDSAGTHQPKDVETVARQIESRFPVPRLNWDHPYDVQVALGQPRDDLYFSYLNMMLGIRRALDGCTLGCKRYYVGVLVDPPTQGTVTVGKAPVGGDVASGYVNDIVTIAHEFGHATGRKHTSCTADPNDEANPGPFPYAGGKISPDVSGDATFFGVDTLTGQVYGPSSGDLMSYCHPRWPSDYTYENIRDHLVSRYGNANAPETRGGLQSSSLLVAGTISLAEGTGDIRSVYTLSSTAMDATAPSGSFALQLRNAAGQEVASYPVDIKVDADGSTASFVAILPIEPSVREVVLLRDGQTIDSRIASEHPPSIRVDFPNGGENLTNAAQVTWTANDVDGDQLTYAVQYSTDGGVTWQTISSDWPLTTYQLDASLLSGTNEGLVRVFATDGFNTAQDQSDSVFHVAGHSPRVTIWAPHTNGAYLGDEIVTLDGSAFDAEDGELAGESLSWSSDVSGFLGVGRLVSLDLSTLSKGVHTIALTATDADGEHTSASITVTVGLSSGDADCDGDADSADALAVLRAVAALSVMAACLDVAGDVDCDGDTDSVDALIILRHVAGLPVNLPDGCPAIGSGSGGIRRGLPAERQGGRPESGRVAWLGLLAVVPALVLAGKRRL